MPPTRPSDNGDPRRRPLQAAPPELPPSRWGTALLAVVSLAWIWAFSPDPVVLATVPGLLAWIAIVERPHRFREVMAWIAVVGAGATVIGYRWLATTIQDFGEVSAGPAWLLTALFGVWGVLHGMIFAAFHRGMLLRGRRPHPLLTVTLLAGAEALPIRLFAWSSGHGAVNVPPLAQAAEWGGVPAVSFALLCLVIPFYEWLRWVFVRRGMPARPVAALATFLVGVVLYGFGMLRYHQVQEEEREATQHVSVAIVQANVGSQRKRRATRDGGIRRDDSIAAYRRGTEKAAARLQALARETGAETAQVIVWPETAITDAVPLHDAQQTNEFLDKKTYPPGKLSYDFLDDLGRDRAFLVGTYEQVTGRRSMADGRLLQDRYNVAALRQPGDASAPWTKYRKVHLIPFGETMPFGIYEDKLPQNFRMRPGELPQPLLAYHGITFAPFLCYEGILADHVRAYAGDERPDVLVSLTNDSWFGDTWEPHQHLNFTRFRAIEHRTYLVRATNTGISAFVSATGDVEERLEVGQEDVLVRDVPLVERGRTVYARFGHHFAALLWIVALAGWFLCLVRAP